METNTTKEQIYKTHRRPEEEHWDLRAQVKNRECKGQLEGYISREKRGPRCDSSVCDKSLKATTESQSPHSTDAVSVIESASKTCMCRQENLILSIKPISIWATSSRTFNLFP